MSPNAAAVHALVVLKAPYAKTSAAVSQVANVNGCGTANITRAPLWSGATGIATEALKGAAKTCTGYWGSAHLSSYGEPYTYLLIAVPVHPSILTTSIQAMWSAKVSGTVRTSHSGTCPAITYYDSSGNATSGCVVISTVQVYTFLYLLDTTNGSTFSGTPPYALDRVAESYWQSQDSCVNYSCATTVSSGGGSFGTLSGIWTNTTYFNGTFNPSDSYELVSIVGIEAGSYIGWFSYPSNQPGGTFTGYASASMNMGYGGAHATLKSISLV
ncbi:MAG: hypothetical protein L3K19_04055 [Thermoplasmata archaeon]|nr:hypothetical protein [Thermoplasmata archaeon]